LLILITRSLEETPLVGQSKNNYFVLIAPSFAESMTKFVEVPEQQGRAAVSKLPRVTILY
jgi:hypothetical protein